MENLEKKDLILLKKISVVFKDLGILIGFVLLVASLLKQTTVINYIAGDLLSFLGTTFSWIATIFSILFVLISVFDIVAFIATYFACEREEKALKEFKEKQ